MCAGCSPATVEKIEVGLRRPSRELAGLLAHCLSIPDERIASFVIFARGGMPVEPFQVGLNGTGGSDAGDRHGALHLPAQATGFIGREHEISEVRELLRREEVRLLTLIGPPGIGKTRLSVRAAEELGGDFADGVFFVPLASITDPDLVVQEIAAATGVRQSGGQSLIDSMRERLQEKKLLVVLDNFEHLPAAAPEVARLLAGVQGLKILATSRVALHIYGEHLFRVPPMSCPDDDAAGALLATQPGRLAEFEAIALFVQRARFVQHEFALTPMNTRAIVGICRKLEGLPLAIELAAFRTNVLPPQVILDKLGHSLDLLANGPSDLPHRQRSLRGAVAWSYGLLSPEARKLFNRCSVFAGGCDFLGIEYLSALLSGDGDTTGPVDTLAALVDSSLLRREVSGGEPRFSMLDTVREFAAEQLAAAGEYDAARRIHAEYYLGLAERAEPELTGPGQTEWLDRLEREHDNLRATLRYFSEVRRMVEVGRMSAALRRFWYFRGHLSEGLAWTGTGLQHREEIPASIVAKMLQGLGTFYWVMGDGPATRRSYSESLAIYRALDDKQGIAAVLNNLGITMTALGDYEGPAPLYLESLQIFRDIGDEWSVCVALSNLGLSALNLGLYDEADKYLTQSLELRRTLNDRQGEAQSLNNLGLVARCKGNYDRARSLHTLSLQTFRDLGDRWSVALAVANLGHVALESHGKTGADEVLQFFKESLALHRELDAQPGVADCFEGLAQAAQKLGNEELAAMLFGAGEKLREELGMPMLPYNCAGYRASRVGHPGFVGRRALP